MASQIGKRVEAAHSQFSQGDFESALHDICSAVEATAKRETGKGGRSSYKSFVRDNFGLMTKAFMGVQIGNYNLAFDHPDLKQDANGTVPIQDIFYHVVRCGLYHGEYLPNNLTFSDKNMFRCDNGKSLVVPSSLILGLILAVVVSPANSKESTSDKLAFRIKAIEVPLNWLWGKKPELLALLNALHADDTDETRKCLKAIDPRLTIDNSSLPKQ